MTENGDFKFFQKLNEFLDKHFKTPDKGHPLRKRNKA